MRETEQVTAGTKKLVRRQGMTSHVAACFTAPYLARAGENRQVGAGSWSSIRVTVRANYNCPQKFWQPGLLRGICLPWQHS